VPPGDCPERHHQRIVAHRHFSIANVPRIFRVPLQRAFAQSEMSVQYRLVIDLGDLLRADPEARWQSWQRARAAGVLSPNDVRLEEGWPASDDPTASSIEPPVAGGRAANGDARAHHQHHRASLRRHPKTRTRAARLRASISAGAVMAAIKFGSFSPPMTG